MSTATGTPLSQPLYGASIGQAVSRFFKKYATFSGRASRSEFWWWYLVFVVVTGVLYAIAVAVGTAGATREGGVLLEESTDGLADRRSVERLGERCTGCGGHWRLLRDGAGIRR